MGYERTQKIRDKQSAKMRENRALGKWDENSRRAKHQEAISARKKLGLSFGRPKASVGGVYIKRGKELPCPVCGVLVYHQPKMLTVGRRKCCSRRCSIVNPEFTKKLRSIKRAYPRLGLRNPTTPEYVRYRNAVHRKSAKTYFENAGTINPNGHPRTRCGVLHGWQLDHIKPIRECFDDGDSVEEAASVGNLRMLPWKDNLMRNWQ